MNNIIIFYTILLIIIMYILASTIENFQTTPPAGPTDQIKEAVKQIYLADVESIRNLSAVATNLQKDGGLVTPANMSIRGKLSVGSAADIKTSLVDLLVENPTAPTTVTLKTKLDDNNITLTNTEGAFKISNKTVDLFNINKDGNVMKNGLTTASLTTTGDIIAKGKTDITGALTASSIVIGTPVAGATGAVGTTTITPTAITTSSITATEIAGANTRKKARYLIVGNKNRKDLAIGAWTLVKIEAYDNTGVNVIEGKPTKKIEGEPANSTFKPENTNTGTVFSTATNMVDNANSGYHGKDEIVFHALEYDLGKEFYIDQIVLHNRWHGGTHNNLSVTARMNGTTIELFDANKKLLRTIQTGNWNQAYSKEYLL